MSCEYMFWYRTALPGVKRIYRCSQVLPYSQRIGRFYAAAAVVMVILMSRHAAFCWIRCCWYRLIRMTCDVIRSIVDSRCIYPCLKLIIVANILIAKPKVRNAFYVCGTHWPLVFELCKQLACLAALRWRSLAWLVNWVSDLMLSLLHWHASSRCQLEQSVGCVCGQWLLN